VKKEETLQRIKAAEGQIRSAKERAAAERERILRDARREAFELRESLRREAEKRYEEILREADRATAHEKETILAAGRKRAAELAGQASGNLDRAVDLLIQKFKGALNV